MQVYGDGINHLKHLPPHVQLSGANAYNLVMLNMPMHNKEQKVSSQKQQKK